MNKIIYQIFLRPFTPEGTIAAAEKLLPHLAKLGVDVAYITAFCDADADPNPAFWSDRQRASGILNPKNPYRVADYFKIDEEYGSHEDFAQFVKTDSVNGTVNYSYDGLGQLQTETTANGTTAYTYDTRGNRIGMNKGGIISQYTYDTGNHLLSQVENVGGANEQQTTYTYDNNGNLILRQTGQLSDSASQTESVSLTGQTEQISNTIQGASMVWYEYNSFGQLSGVSTDTGMQASYTYDAMGRRASKTVNGIEKRHLWNGERISAEADANNAITDIYFQLGSLSAHKTTDNLYYYLYDGHGSVVGMKDESQSGDATAMYNYDAFGNSLTIPTLENPFRYCGEYYDAETGMIYLRNRYYDPSIGRFITEDPVHDGLNWYAYCHNDPINFYDTLGLEESRDKEVLTKDDYEKIQMLTAIFNYAKYSLQDIAIADEAHRQAIKIRQQDKYSYADGYGPVRPASTSSELQYTNLLGAYDFYDYSKSSAVVTIKIGKPLSSADALYESGEWINSVSESGGFAIVGSYWGMSDEFDLAGNLASEINGTLNPLSGKVSEGDIVVSVYKKQIHKKTIQFYFDGDDKQKCYYVKGD